MAIRLLTALRALLASPDRLSTELRDEARALRSLLESSVNQEKKTHRTDIEALRREISSLRDEMRDRLLQYHLQLGRLSSLVNGGSSPAHGDTGGTLSGHLPTTVEPLTTSGPIAAAPASARDWFVLTMCPACGSKDRTVVCEWNKLVMLDSAPDALAGRYDYAVCHACGILYATGRPTGERYRYLVEHFEEVLDKNAARNLLLNPYPLTDDDRRHYRQLIARGVFVSDHVGGEYLSGVFKDRVENAGHVDILGSLVNLRDARVLEVRPRAGTILEGLRRHYGASVFGMPLWEGQQLILRELYGIESAPLDFDRFSIPFDRPFDLIVCNHMINHAVHLDRFLATIREALKPGGHLYIYNEIDDSEFLHGGQSMIATMNPLHLQAADRPSLVRAVSAAGFQPVFVKGRDKRNFCLMRKVEEPNWTPISDPVLEKRIGLYQRARDRAVLRTPEEIRHRFADVWPATVERAVASGVARFDDEGRLRVVKG